MFFEGGYNITSGYGDRMLNGEYNHHNGVDVVPKVVGNNTIISNVMGIVVDSGCNSTLGNYIKIKSHDKYTSLFYHMKELPSKRVNDIVDVGEIIGTMGNTGYSFGAHLHYGVVSPDGYYINPMQYIVSHETMLDRICNELKFSNETKDYINNYKFKDDLIKTLWCSIDFTINREVKN